jgi:L-lactate dehydrogenase (cytochrome)
MLTLDLPVPTVRREEIRCGLSIPPRLTRRNAIDVVTKPAWALGVLLGKRRTFGNLAGRMERAGITTLAQWIATQFDPSVTWKDVEWVRSRWPGKLIVKGVLDAEDARLACGVGVDALVVSNHGGRQLDGAPSSISALPDVRAATAERCEVLFDGGVLSGQDVLKALARGASACLIGKAFLYGLAAQGQPGVTKVLEIIHGELRATLGLTGISSIRDVGPRVLRTPRP